MIPSSAHRPTDLVDAVITPVTPWLPTPTTLPTSHQRPTLSRPPTLRRRRHHHSPSPDVDSCRGPPPRYLLFGSFQGNGRSSVIALRHPPKLRPLHPFSTPAVTPGASISSSAQPAAPIVSNQLCVGCGERTAIVPVPEPDEPSLSCSGRWKPSWSASAEQSGEIWPFLLQFISFLSCASSAAVCRPHVPHRS